MLAQLAALLLAVTSSSGPAVQLLDFRADYCGPCRAMDPVVHQLAAAGYPVRQVNVDQDRALAAKFQVQAIPCFVMTVDGKELYRSTGMTSAAALQDMFRKAGYDPSAKAIARSDNDSRARGTEFPAAVSDAPLSVAAGPSPADAVAAANASAAQSPAPQNNDWIAKCVRIKVADPKGNSVGSGTIIDARQGEGLILTCGHIFRDSDGKGQITVDLFGPGAPQHVAGRLVGCDLERDIGLVSISATYSLAAAHVAGQNYHAHAGDRVITVGCSHGADPTVQESHVDSLDKFRGPANLEVAGQPVQGRSGGGLFNEQGDVIGVCNAADPTDNEGLFAALPSIYHELDRAKLSFVYRATNEIDAAEAPAALASADLPAMPQKMPAASLADAASPTATSDNVPTQSRGHAAPDANAKSQFSAEEIATLAELRDKVRSAEVICIVRPLGNSQAKSEIIVLDKASQAFLDQLSAAQSPSRQLTSLEVPAARSAQPATSQP